MRRGVARGGARGRVQGAGAEGEGGGPGFCVESLVNGCPTRRSLPFLLSSRPGDGYRARHATPCNAAQRRALLVELRSSGRSWTFQWQQKRQHRSRDPLIPARKNFFAELSRRPSPRAL